MKELLGPMVYQIFGAWMPDADYKKVPEDYIGMVAVYVLCALVALIAYIVKKRNKRK